MGSESTSTSMFGDRDSHWWFHLDQQTGDLWLAGRFGALRLRTGSGSARPQTASDQEQGHPARTAAGAPVDPPVGPA